MAIWRQRLELLGDKVFRGRLMQQFAALFYKNVLVAWRSRRATLVRLLAPFLFLLMALVVNVSLNANNASQVRYKAVVNSSGEPISPIPDCTEDLYMGNRDCITFLYTPNTDDVVQKLVERIRSNNGGKPIPQNKVLGFASRKASDEWFLANPDKALGAVHFVKDSSTGDIDYILQSNSTTKYFKGTFQDPTTFFQVPLMNAVAREISREFVTQVQPGVDFSWSPALVKFPHPNLDTQSLLGTVLAAFIFASLMFGFVTQLGNLASEKALGLRQALRNMGMRDSAYWLSWGLFDALLNLITALLVVIFGLILQFDYFKKNDFGVLFMLFWLFTMSMTSFGYFLSVFIKKPQTAVYVGFIIFIVGWVFQTVQYVGDLPYSPTYYYSKTNKWGRVFFGIFNLFPWNPLTKGIMDLAYATASEADPGIRWADHASYCQYIPNAEEQPQFDPTQQYRDYLCVFPMSQVYGALIIQWICYMVAAVYLNNVLPNEVGNSRKPWYFLTLSYWRPRPAAATAALQAVLAQERSGYKQPPQESQPEEDVAAEEERVMNLLLQRTGGGETKTDSDKKAAAELFGLRKVFRSPRSCLPWRWKKGGGGDFWAIKGTWLGIDEGQLFCLLGPNGAGKTTTINCLTGVLPITGGDALVYGESIGHEGGLDRIRSIMGVCPQFDVLWAELSGTEHLIIYGLVKGLPFSTVRGQAAKLLEKVKLTPAAASRSSSYSGGMKRRLSVAIALLGDPKIVYLDEPTTGMDPISRRYVWDIIQEAKVGRALVLTTHSMEEADILGDRIAIMARGRIRVLGSSIRLKQKFGAGYRVSVSVLPAYGGASGTDLAGLASKAGAVKGMFQQYLQLQPVEESKAYMQYLVGREAEGTLVALLADLESRRDQLGVTDIQLSLTSLEEVFLTIAKQAELDAAAASGKTTLLVELPDGTEMEVPLGQDTATHPDTGVVYSIKWAQDEGGNLVVLDASPQEQ